MKIGKLYKGRYSIGIYERGGDEQLVTLFNSTFELAVYLGVSVKLAYTIIAQRKKEKRKGVVIKGRIYDIELVDVL